MRKLIVIVPAAAALLTGQAADAGTIYLKNGQELIGRVVEITDEHVVISVDNGLVTISRRAVDAIGLEPSDPAARRLGLRKSAVYETQPEPGTTLEQARLEANRAAAQTARTVAEQRRRKAIEHEAEIYAPYQIRRGDVAFRLANRAFERKQYLTAQKKYEDARDAYQRALTAATERRAEIERLSNRKEQLRRLAEIRRARERLEKQRQAERERAEREQPPRPHGKQLVVIPGQPEQPVHPPTRTDRSSEGEAEASRTQREAAARVAEAELERKAREEALKRVKALEEAAALHARTQALLAARTELAHLEARAREREQALAERLADFEQRANALRTWLQIRGALEQELAGIGRSGFESERLQSLERTLREALSELAGLDQRWSETATERDRLEERLRTLRSKIADLEALSTDEDALLAGDSIGALEAGVEQTLAEPLPAAPPSFDAFRTATERGEQAALAAHEEIERLRQDEQRRALVERADFQAELAALEAQVREAHTVLEESKTGIGAARNVAQGIAAVRERLMRALEAATAIERPGEDVSEAVRHAERARTALIPFSGLNLEQRAPTTLEALLAQIDALRDDPRSPAEVRASTAYTEIQAATGAYVVYVATIQSVVERVVPATATLLEAERAASTLERAIERERSRSETSELAEAELERAAIEAARLEAERLREQAEREAERLAAEREAERVAKEQEARLAAERAALEAARAKALAARSKRRTEEANKSDEAAAQPAAESAALEHEIERALAEAQAMAQAARLAAEKQTSAHTEARPDQAAPSAEDEAEQAAIAAAKQAAERAEAAAAEEAAREAAERAALEAEKLAAAKKAAEEAARRAAEQQAAERAAKERERAEAAAAEEAAREAAERAALEAEKLAAAKKAAEEAARRAETERKLAEAAAAAEAERRQAAAQPPQTTTPSESGATAEAAQTKQATRSARQLEALRARLLAVIDRAQVALENEELARANALYDEVRAALAQLDTALAARREIKGFSTRLVSRERKAKAARENLTLAADDLLERATEWEQALLDVASRAAQLVAADDPGSENTVALLEKTLETATDQLAALDTSPERLEQIRGAAERARQAASDLAKEIARKGAQADLEQPVATIQEERQRWEQMKNEVRRRIAHAREVEAKRKAQLAEAERQKREQEALARAQAEAKRRQREAAALEAAKAKAEEAALRAALERARHEAERQAAEQAALRQAKLEQARDLLATLHERLAAGKNGANHALELAPAAIERAARLRVAEAKLAAALDARAQVKSFSTRLASLTRKAKKAKGAIETLLPKLDLVRKAEPSALEWQQLAERLESLGQDQDTLLAALENGQLAQLEQRLEQLAPTLEAAAGVSAAVLQQADDAIQRAEQAAESLAAEVEKRSKLQVDFEAAKRAAEQARREREAEEARQREERARAQALAQARAEAQAREAAERAAKEAAAREVERQRFEEQQRLAEEARRLAEARAQAEAEKQPPTTATQPVEQQAAGEQQAQGESTTSAPQEASHPGAETTAESTVPTQDEDAAARARRLAEEQAAQAALEAAARAAEQAAREEAKRAAEQEAEAKRIEAERKARLEAARAELDEARRSVATLLNERQSLQARLAAQLEILAKTENRLTKAQARRAAFKGSSEELARLDAKAPELHARLGEARRAVQRLLEGLSRFDEARALDAEVEQLGADPARVLESESAASLERLLERSRMLLDALERASTEIAEELEAASVLNDEAIAYVEALDRATEAARKAAAEAQARALAEANVTLRALDVKLDEIGAKAKRVRSELQATRALLERQREQIAKASKAGQAHPAVLELAEQATEQLEAGLHKLAALEQRLVELADTQTLRSQRDALARDERALLEGQESGALSALADTVDGRAQSITTLADQAARAVQEAKRTLAQAGQVAMRMRETIEAQARARAAKEAQRLEAEAQARREAQEKARREAEQETARKAREAAERSAARLQEQAKALAAGLELAQQPVASGRMALQPPATWTSESRTGEGLIRYRAPAKEGETYRPRLNFVEIELPGLSAKEVADQLVVELEHRGFASIERETREIGGKRGIEIRSVFEREDGTVIEQRQFVVARDDTVGVLTVAGPRERAAEVIAAYLRVVESLR